MNIRVTAFEALEDLATELMLEYQASAPEACVHLLQAAMIHVTIGVMLSTGDDTDRAERLEMLDEVIATTKAVALRYTQEDLH